MYPVNMNDISFFQVELFLTAGRELNFTRAAQLCNVTQPTVSRQISALEQSLGISLFSKKGGRLKLTPAGNELYLSMKKMMLQLGRSIKKAQDVQEGYREIINISFPPNVDYPRYFMPAMDFFSNQAENKDLRLSFRVEEPSTAIENLLNYDTDVIFVYYHYKDQIQRHAQLEQRTAISVPLSAVMHRTNPLSSKKSIRLDELGTQTLLFPDGIDEVFRAMLSEYFAKANIVPRVTSFGSMFEPLMNLTASDEVVITDRISMQGNYVSLVCVSIDGTESGIIMAWRREDGRFGPIKRFLDFAADSFQSYSKYSL